MDTHDSELTRVDVKIYGDTYTILGEAGYAHIIKISNYVDQKMKELAMAFPMANARQLAVLAAVNIADELLQNQENESVDMVTKVYEEKTKKLINKLDEGLIGDIY